MENKFTVGGAVPTDMPRNLTCLAVSGRLAGTAAAVDNWLGAIAFSGSLSCRTIALITGGQTPLLSSLMRSLLVPASSPNISSYPIARFSSGVSFA